MAGAGVQTMFLLAIIAATASSACGASFRARHPAFAPKYGDWMNDYDEDKFANCLMVQKCSGSYHPVCAGNKTHDSNCHASCAGFEKAQVKKGECGGCVAPSACCQTQDGGISKAIDWGTGSPEQHLVCLVSGEGRRCPEKSVCTAREATNAAVPDKDLVAPAQASEELRQATKDIIKDKQLAKNVVEGKGPVRSRSQEVEAEARRVIEDAKALEAAPKEGAKALEADAVARSK